MMAEGSSCAMEGATSSCAPLSTKLLCADQVLTLFAPFSCTSQRDGCAVEMDHVL